MRHYDASGGAVELAQQLGRGGEGSVFGIGRDDKLVAKVYHKLVDREKALKITTMARLGTERLTRLSAWPVSPLYDKPGGAVVGFLMPKVVGHKEIHTLYSPKDRLANFPNAGWSFLVHTAANVARAFAAIHEHHHVVGDVNHGNVVVSSQATVMLIDCDSFQIVEQGHRFLCEVGVSTHTPPELQGKPFGSTLRTANHDAFGLAVLIFQLLFMGRHPFSGQFLGAGEMPLEKAISGYRFAYGANAASRQMKQPPGSLPLETVTSPVAGLFERAFGMGTRPSPLEWVHALEHLSKQLQRCVKNSGHDYPRALAACPWCTIETGSGLRLFHIVVAGGWQPGKPGKPLNFDAIWAQITAIPAPPPMPVPAAPPVTPSPSVVQLGKRQRTFVWTGWGGGLGGLICAAAAQADGLFWWAVGAYLFAVTVAHAGSSKTEAAKAEIKPKLKEAQDKLKSLTQRWEREATDAPFSVAMKKLHALRQEYVGLGEERQRKLQDLEKNRQKTQLEKYLDRFRLEDAAISGVGASRKATLASYGVETAADISSRAIENIPGFGPTLSSQLMAWRQMLEKRFVFNPRQGVDPSDIAVIEIYIAARRTKIETEMQQAPSLLKQVTQQIGAQRELLHPLIMDAAQTAAQAEADLKAL